MNIVDTLPPGVYANEYNDTRWHRRREEIRNLYGRKCADCGIDESSHHRKLDVHHLNRVSGKRLWDYDDNELVPLCQRCHTARHVELRAITK